MDSIQGRYYSWTAYSSDETWSASEGEMVSKLVQWTRRSLQKNEGKINKRLSKKMHRGNGAYNSSSNVREVSVPGGSYPGRTYNPSSNDREVAVPGGSYLGRTYNSSCNDREVAVPGGSYLGRTYNSSSNDRDVAVPGGSYLGRIMEMMPGYQVETVVDYKKQSRRRDFEEISRIDIQVSRKLKPVPKKEGPSQPRDADDDVKAWHQYYSKKIVRGKSTRDDEDEEAAAVQSLHRGPSQTQYAYDDVKAWHQYYGKKNARGESTRDDEDEEAVAVQSLRRGDDGGGRKVAGSHVARRKEENRRAKSRDHGIGRTELQVSRDLKSMFTRDREKGTVCAHADDVEQWHQYYPRPIFG